MDSCGPTATRQCPNQILRWNTRAEGGNMRNCLKLSRRPVAISLFLCSALLAAIGSASAGQETASIIGQVKDESGALLPGVTVIGKSPSLQVREVTAVTDAQGEYRLTPLPIGTYEVNYELTGFATIRREELRLTAGFVARVDVVMKVGSLEESIQVTGASPIVDVTATGTSSRLTTEMLETTPTGRVGFFALLAQAPGVRNALDIGGSSANANSITFRAFGQSGESWQTLEGVLTSSAKTSMSGNYFDYASVEEARVQSIGADASMPLRGIMMAADRQVRQQCFPRQHVVRQYVQLVPESERRRRTLGERSDESREPGRSMDAQFRPRRSPGSRQAVVLHGSHEIARQGGRARRLQTGRDAGGRRQAIGLVEREGQLSGEPEPQARRVHAAAAQGRDPQYHAVRALGITRVPGSLGLDRQRPSGRPSGAVPS